MVKRAPATAVTVRGQIDCLGVDMSNAICQVQDCGRSARSKSAGICAMHYHRRYRHGDVERTAAKANVSASNGRKYRIVYRPGHPLADRSGRIYEHRLVVWETFGSGDLACHYCGASLRWELPKEDPAAVQIDHLNDHSDDNRPENLVPACRACNLAKASTRRHDALVAAGWWSGRDTIAGLKGYARRRVTA